MWSRLSDIGGFWAFSLTGREDFSCADIGQYGMFLKFSLIGDVSYNGVYGNGSRG